MKKKIFFGILGITILLASFVALSHFTKKDDVSKTNKLNVFVLSKSSSRVVVQDSNNLIYTFNNNDLDFDVGSQIVISYTGVLSNTSSLQKASILIFSTVPVSEDYESIPDYSSYNRIFSQFYKLAKQKRIEHIAKMAAKSVGKTKIEVSLDPMNSYARRIVHNTLANSRDVYTESFGEEPNRYVVIKPKKLK